MNEVTLAIIKPGAVRRKKVGEILTYIESLGDLHITAMERVNMTIRDAAMFYHEHEGRPYYENLIEQTTSGPCVALILAGPDAIHRWRNVIGPYDGSSGLRAFFGAGGSDNGLHGSDSVESADREIDILFSVSEQPGAVPEQVVEEAIPQARFLRIDPRAVLPTKGTPGSAGYDFYVIHEYILLPHTVTKCATGWKTAPPPGYELQIRSRSGLGSKGIVVANSPGTVDEDYRGEMFICLLNTTDRPYKIMAGDRVAQIVPRRVDPCDFVEVSELDNTSRGESGYGSTGR